MKPGASAISCAVLLTILAAAQVPPRALSSATEGAVVQSPAPVAATPTPSLKVPAPSPPPRPGRHDLSRYDQAGPFAVPAGLPRPAREAVMAQIRSFLLEHWQGRRLGHLVVQLPGPQGGTVPWAFYVEPGERGAWAITLEAGGRVETFSLVEEVELPGDGPPMLEPGVKSRGPQAGTKALHLKRNAEAMSGLVL
jgi:hypothetical protein